MSEDIKDVIEDKINEYHESLVNLGAFCFCETLKKELNNSDKENFTLSELLEILGILEDKIKNGDTEYCEDFCDECGDDCDGCAGE